ncbi:hypothetical protein EDB87DRAFT_1581800 [Lactarius vividus]|nr:hypothetical protein EDB87DRAFT_1581800 [Lactarius vividus]
MAFFVHSPPSTTDHNSPRGLHTAQCITVIRSGAKWHVCQKDYGDEGTLLYWEANFSPCPLHTTKSNLVTPDASREATFITNTKMFDPSRTTEKACKITGNFDQRLTAEGYDARVHGISQSRGRRPPTLETGLRAGGGSGRPGRTWLVAMLREQRIANFSACWSGAKKKVYGNNDSFGNEKRGNWRLGLASLDLLRIPRDPTRFVTVGVFAAAQRDRGYWYYRHTRRAVPEQPLFGSRALLITVKAVKPQARAGIASDCKRAWVIILVGTSNRRRHDPQGPDIENIFN